MSSKDRRHSGWVTPRLTTKNKHKEIVAECLEPQPFYDDWNNYRDSFRDWKRDRTKIKPWSLLRELGDKELIRNNYKLKRKLKIRLAKKSQHLYSS